MAGRVAALRSQEQPRPHAWREMKAVHGGATGGTATGVCMRVDSLLADVYIKHYRASFMFLTEFLSHTHRRTRLWQMHRSERNTLSARVRVPCAPL